MSGWLTTDELAEARADFAAGNGTVATVLRRDPGNVSPRGGEGGPYAEVGTVRGRLRPAPGSEADQGGRLVQVGTLEFLCVPPAALTSYGRLDLSGLDVDLTLSGLADLGDPNLTARDQLQIAGIRYEVSGLDSDRTEPLVQVVMLRKAV